MLDSLLRPETLARAHPAALASYLRGPKFKRPAHIDLISRTVAEAIIRGGARLLISTPPQHAKSTTVAEALPTWIFDRDPSHRVLAASYSDNLGKRAVRRVRDTGQEFRDKLRWRVSESKASETHFEVLAADGTVSGLAPGYMKGVGILGSITGDGYDTILVDDLYKNPEEAFSAGHRKKVEEAFESVLMTRLSARGNVIVIMTRWHYDDAIGVRMRRGGWQVLNLPALAEENDPLGREPGAPLWPGMKPLEFLLEQKEAMTPRIWSALYQGSPTKSEGSMFVRGWFKVLDQRPSLVKRRVRYWDPAASKKQERSDPDYAVGVLMSEARADVPGGWRWCVEDVVRLRGTASEVERAILTTAASDGRSVPIEIEREPGSESELYLNYLRTHVLPGFSVTPRPHGTDKLTRAKPLSAHVEMGNVAVVASAWNAAFFDELEAFPDDRHHDDQVDAFTGAWEAFVSSGVRWPWAEAMELRTRGTMRDDDAEDRSSGAAPPDVPGRASPSPVLSRPPSRTGFAGRVREGLSSLR